MSTQYSIEKPAQQHGYPTRIIGLWAINFKNAFAKGETPTAEQMVRQASYVIKMTQKINAFPGAFITGRKLTAAPHSGKNGSLFTTVERDGKLLHADVLAPVTAYSLSALKRTEEAGIYVTSPRKWSKPDDIDGVGLMMIDGDHDVVGTALYSRDELAGMAHYERKDFGELLLDLSSLALLVYLDKTRQLAS